MPASFSRLRRKLLKQGIVANDIFSGGSDDQSFSSLRLSAGELSRALSVVGVDASAADIQTCFDAARLDADRRGRVAWPDLCAQLSASSGSDADPDPGPDPGLWGDLRTAPKVPRSTELPGNLGALLVTGQSPFETKKGGGRSPRSPDAANDRRRDRSHAAGPQAGGAGDATCGTCVP